MRNQKWITGILCCCMTFSLLTGCGGSKADNSEAEATPAVTETVTETPTPTAEPTATQTPAETTPPEEVALSQQIISGDGVCQLMFPENWTDMKGQLNAELALEAGCLDEEEFLTLLGETKDGSSLESLAEYTDVLTGYIAASFTDPVVGDRQELEINGRKATKTKITGVTSDVEVAYWVYTIEGTKQYVQICTWTTPGNAAAGEGLFDKIVQSYTEL